MRTVFLLLSIILLVSACEKEYIPKPRGYFRIDFPQKEYVDIDSKYPYLFSIPQYSKFKLDTQKGSEPFWSNIYITEHNAELHISYKKVENNLSTLMDESRSLAYKHSIKADAIDEQVYENPDTNVYGTIYLIDGNAASPIQFYLTDSTQHFIRGALYFREIPNIDSIRPVIEFLHPDIIHLIETTSWRE